MFCVKCNKFYRIMNDVRTVLLSAAIVEYTRTYIIHYSIKLITFSAEYTLFNNCNFNLVYRYSLSVNLTQTITV
jgi:hypothetical protein